MLIKINTEEAMKVKAHDATYSQLVWKYPNEHRKREKRGKEWFKIPLQKNQTKMIKPMSNGNGKMITIR